MSIFDISKKKRTSVTDSIPFTQIYADGTIELKKGLYSRMYRLDDINFTIAPEKEQKAIFRNYEKMLNSFSEPFQIIVHNYKANRKNTMDNIRFNIMNDNLNGYRQEMNGILLDKLYQGNGSLQQSKYIVFTHAAANIESAMHDMNEIENTLYTNIQAISDKAGLKRLDMQERLKVMFHIYNQNKKDDMFYNAVDPAGNGYFDPVINAKQGRSIKSAIAPEGMMFERNTFLLGDVVGRTLYFDRVPAFLSTNFMHDLTSINAEMIISLNHEPVERDKARSMIKRHLRNLNAHISKQESNAAREGFSSANISEDVRSNKAATLEMMDDIDKRDQGVFFLTFTVTVFASDNEEMQAILTQLKSISKPHHTPFQVLMFQQEEGLNSCLPLSVNKLDTKMLLTSECCSIMLPYTSQELHQKNGAFYGMNKTSGQMIIYDRHNDSALNRNFNALFFGDSGSGKSGIAKWEIMSILLRSTRDVVYVIDPQREYIPIAEAVGGEVVELSPSSKNFENPLDLDLASDGEDNPIALKSDFIIGMIEIMNGTGEALDPRCRSIIDRCVKKIYQGYIAHIQELNQRNPEITCDKDAAPTISNLYHELRRQDSPDADQIANILEIYATGTSDIFAHRSNVSTNKRMVVYDISKLGAGMKPLGLYITLNDIWSKMISNSRKGIYSWIYIDEFHLLLQLESSANFLKTIWKTARKWKGVPTGITQNVEDLLGSTATRDILNLTNFVLMTSMSAQDRNNMADLIQIQDAQLEKYCKSQPKGHGLIYTGDTTLPFALEIPKGTKMFELVDTNKSPK